MIGPHLRSVVPTGSAGSAEPNLNRPVPVGPTAIPLYLPALLNSLHSHP